MSRDLDAADPAVWQRIADAGIRVMRIPTPFQVGRVNTYLLEDEPLTLVDSGPNSGKALDELERQLDALGHRIDDVELVIVTHQHIDHLGLVDIVAKRSGAEVAAIDVAVPFLENFGDDAERDDEEAAALMRRHGISEEVVTALRQVTGSFRAWGSKTKVNRPLHDGDVLELRDRRLEVQHRPGHSPSDTVFWDEQRRILLAADHLIKHISSNPLISRPLDGSRERTQALVAYLESLKRTRELPAEIVLSGHGEPITDHVGLIDQRFALHQRRAEKLYALIAEQPRTGHELAQALWGDVAVTQAFLTLSEVIGHADLLVNAGHVREVEDGEVVRYEATSDLPADRLGDLIPGGNPVLSRG
ncbi:MAG TPA: MBL fold metallo-hydrolase [Solirubrobacterales bacterium]|jgi:glyoxylase-like metal-dependent hydrolase (beta-lactamase superfamily II)